MEDVGVIIIWKACICSREKRRDGGKKRGRPMECRGCVAGFAHGNCVSEIVSTQGTFP